MNTRLHIWSDYVCPFCLIAQELIDRVMAQRPGVEVVHHPYELRRHPAPTLRPEDDYLPNIWRRAVLPMARRHGVPLALPTISPQPYTETAFVGAQYAADQGMAGGYHRRLLTAFFREHLDIGNRQVLVELAREVGLDSAGFLGALDSAERRQEHRRALSEASRLGITVVPTIIIGDRRIEGVAEEGVLLRAIDEAAAAGRKARVARTAAS